MSQDTSTLQQASVRHHCKAVRMPAIGANFVALAEQAVREKRSHIVHRAFSLGGDHRDHIDHSGLPELQANSDGNPTWAEDRRRRRTTLKTALRPWPISPNQPEHHGENARKVQKPY